ncbi:MAG: 2-C-methyl-D-erythritol 2,4-cyclodiphosphate synthase, partial [Pseudomonadota bacterium]
GWHALTDAILGALAAGDIGDHFSPSDPRWAGAPSSTFLDFARQLVAECGFRIANVDVTLICEAPKIAPHRDAMRAATADLLQLSLDAVSIKATTTEKLGFTGRSEGIAAQASVSLVAAPSFPGQT